MKSRSNPSAKVYSQENEVENSNNCFQTPILLLMEKKLNMNIYLFSYLGSKVNISTFLDDEIVKQVAKATRVLLYGSESGTPYRSRVNQVDAVHKR